VKPFSFESNIFLNAQYVVFNEEFTSMETFSDFLLANHQGWVKEAQEGNVEALLRLSISCSVLDDNNSQAIYFGESALNTARDSGLLLGRFWFTLGFVYQANEDIDSAKNSFLNAIQSGFGNAFTNLGDIVLVYDQNLRDAVYFWKIGRDEHNLDDCRQSLSDIEIGPGTYSASIQLDDGSIEMIFYNDTQDGFGNLGS
jgi:hypothetical protein